MVFSLHITNIYSIYRVLAIQRETEFLPSRPCQEGVHRRNEVNGVLKDAEGSSKSEGRKSILSTGNSLDRATMVSVVSHGYLLGGKVVVLIAHEVGKGQVAEAGDLGIYPPGQPVLTFRVPLAHVCWNISTWVTSWVCPDRMFVMKQDINVPCNHQATVSRIFLKAHPADLGLYEILLGLNVVSKVFMYALIPLSSY